MIVFLIVLVVMVIALWFAARFRNSRRRPEPGNRTGEGVSLLVPFRSDGGVRAETWHWLRRYWADALPGAEIVIGTDSRVDEDAGRPFSKTRAVNDAASRATGDIFVILDADCYIYAAQLMRAVRRIRDAREDGHRLWFIPYRRFYRLNRAFSRRVLESDPRHPLWPGDFPHREIVDVIPEKSSSCAHWFGALIQVMPREAFETVGGMDPRHFSWGGDDVDFMRAVDTLWARHHTENGPVFHLWHPTFGNTSPTRFWKGGQAGQNDWLASLYTDAIGDPERMRRLVDEGFEEE